MNTSQSAGRPTLSDLHLHAIGMIVVIWSYIEMKLEVAICGLYDIDPNRGLVFTTNIGFRSRIDLLRVLAKGGAIKNRELAAEMLKMLKRIEQGYIKRNGAAHGVWSGTDDPRIGRRMSIRTKGGRLTCADDMIPLDHLQATAIELDDLQNDLTRLMVRLNLPNSPLSANPD